MSFSNYWEDDILDTLFSSTRYLGFSTVDPGEDGSALSEPSGNNYARISITSGSWDAASGGSKSTNVDLQSNNATGSWGTLQYACLFDAVSGGNLLASVALSSSATVSTGEAISISAGDLSVSLD